MRKVSVNGRSSVSFAMKRTRDISIVLLALSGVYLYGWPSATIPYFATVVLHTVIGVLLTAVLLPLLAKYFPAEEPVARTGWLLMALGAGVGIALIFVGTPNRLHAWL